MAKRPKPVRVDEPGTEVKVEKPIGVSPRGGPGEVVEKHRAKLAEMDKARGK